MIITHYQYSAENMLDGKSFEEGALYFIEDTQHVYLDPVGGSERIRIASDINILASETDRENLLAPIPGKMYFVLETSKYYIFYGDTWYAGGGSNKPRAGLIYINPGSSLPEGFLWCDGATYSRSDYPELFAAIGTNYGSGDGSTTFNVPDLTTRVPIGAGGDYKLGQTGGDEEDTIIVVNQSGNTNTVDTSAHLYTVVNYIISTGKDSKTLSVSDLITSMQVLPLGVEYGGTGADNPSTALSNLGGVNKSYVDTSVSNTKTNMTTYTDNSVNNAKNTLTDYIDNKVANIDTGASKEYVDQAIAGIDTGATEQYVDNAVSSLNTDVREYVDQQIAGINTGASEEYVNNAIQEATENMVVDVPTLQEHLANEDIILSGLQYGTELPDTGVEGQVFFKIITSSSNSNTDSSQNVDLTGYATEQWVQEGFQPKGEYLTEAPVQSVNGKTGVVSLSAADVGALPNTYTPADDETIIEHSEKLDVTNLAYATCDTASDTAEKVVTISGNDHWKLNVGSVVMIYFTNSNSASNVTINVNGTGAYPIWYNNAEYVKTDTSYTGYARRIIKYMFNGTHWVWIGSSYDANTTYKNAALGHGYATCSTEESTAAKVGTLTSYELTLGGIVAVRFTNAVPDNATLNINSKGAKNMFYRGAAITTGVIKAGDTATFIYDGTQYQLISIDRWHNDITTLQNTFNNISLGVHTDGLVYLFINGSPVGTGIEMSAEIYGYVDSENTIIVKGNLANGAYTVKYEMDDSTTIDIGGLDIDNNVYKSVTNALTNCTNGNTATQVLNNESYYAIISANNGYELSSVVVTMGGTDISATAVSDGVITIASVTGDIVITAVAEAISTQIINQIPISTNADGTLFVGTNGEAGYKTGYRVRSSSGDEQSYSGIEVTGFIPIKWGDTIYIRDITLVNSGTCSICLYDANHTFINGTYMAAFIHNTAGGGTSGVNGEVMSSTLDENSVFGNKCDENSGIAYMRFSATTITDDSILTINQPINEGTTIEPDVVNYSVANNLTNCTSSNNATQIVDKGRYSATISANDGYKLSSVVVTMGGTDISSTAISNGVITIANVTGDIVITAVAEEETDEDETVATNFFDASSGFVGRLSSNGANRTDSSSSFVTNYISVQKDDVIVISGCDICGQMGSGDNVFMTGYNSNKSNVYTDKTYVTNVYWSVDSISDNSAQLTVLDGNIAYFRFTCKNSDQSSAVDTSTITINIKRNGEWL